MAHRGLSIEPLERRVLLSAEPTLIQPMANQPLYTNAGQSEAVGLGTLRFYLGDNNSIWRTDGTAAGTYTLGTGSHLTAFNQLGLFRRHRRHSGEPTAPSPPPLRSLKTTLNSGRYPFFSDQALFAADGKLVAILDDNQFFTYDGNSAPTKLSGDYELDFSQQYVITTSAMFILSGGEVFRLDLTHNSVTEPFQDRSSTQIAAAGDTLYLTLTIPRSGRVDSAGTLKQLTSGPIFDSYTDFWRCSVRDQRHALFSRLDAPDNTRSVLWRMLPGQNPTQVATFQDGIGLDLLANFNNKLVFDAQGEQQLWITDGTTAGTTELHDGFTQPTTSVSSDLPTFCEFTTIGSHLLFVADTGVYEVWETDSTAAGTIQHDIVHHHASLPPGAEPGGLSAVYGTLYFSADGGDKVGAGLWSMVVNPPTINAPPTANAGGPYSIREGKSITFNAIATDPDADTLTYQWDINGDGLFGDTSGASPHLTWNQLRHLGIKDGPRTFHPRVQVSDGHSNVTSGPATLSIRNTAPSLSIGGSPGPTAGMVYTLPLIASDPGADLVSDWDIDWGDGSPHRTLGGGIGGSRLLRPPYLLRPGTYTLNATAFDDDGSYIVAPATVTVRAAQTVGVAAVDRFNAAFGGGATSPSHVVSAGGVTYFTALDDAGNDELWRTDGTEVGTFALANVSAGNLTAVGDTFSSPSMPGRPTRPTRTCGAAMEPSKEPSPSRRSISLTARSKTSTTSWPGTITSSSPPPVPTLPASNSGPATAPTPERSALAGESARRRLHRASHVTHRRPRRHLLRRHDDSFQYRRPLEDRRPPDLAPWPGRRRDPCARRELRLQRQHEQHLLVAHRWHQNLRRPQRLPRRRMGAHRFHRRRQRHRLLPE